MRYHD